MKKIVSLILASGVLCACDRSIPKPEVASQSEAKNKAISDYADTESDRMLLNNIRKQAASGDEAKDLWINVSDGNVHLKGTVKVDQDKIDLQSKITKVIGVKTVINSLDVKPE